MSVSKHKDLNCQAVINIDSVSKTFSTRQVLNNIELDISSAQSICICGVNGAGKSTLLRIIAGLLRPDLGSVKLNGYDVEKEPEKTKPLLGVISHKSMVYSNLTVFENLFFFATLYGVKKRAAHIKELLDDMGLYSYRYELASILSRGLLQRLAIARALVHQPTILLADEPFSGLDTEASNYLMSTLNDFRNNGGTIIMTTHDINIGIKCCSRVAVLDRAKLILDAEIHDVNIDLFTEDYLSYARGKQ
jgi:heme exporter protein A